MSLPRPLIILFIVMATVLAYAGSFTGQPIWDDHQFVFWVNANNPNLSHWNFWHHHIWPLFDSTAALLHKLWGAQTVYWHVLNFILHACNSVLIGLLVRSWRPSWSMPLAFLFFVHPLNVLTVAWIIQLKTLLCIFFLLLSLFSLRTWIKTPQSKWYFLAVFCFFLSVSAKSATLPVPWIGLVLLILRRKQHARWIVALIPFLALTLFSTWRILSNEQVQTAVSESEQVVEKLIVTVPTEPIPEPVVKVAVPEPVIVESVPVPAPDPAPLPKPVVETPTEVALVPIPEAKPEAKPEPKPEPAPETAPVSAPAAPPSMASFVLHNLGSYFALPWLPWPVSPVHGTYQGGVEPRAVAGFLLTFILLVVGWRKRSWLPLKIFFIQTAILIPYLGFIVVPYMSYTSISEQHFYLMLPFTLALQFWFFDLLPKKIRTAVLVGIGVAFLGITADYNQSFKNERVFYERILQQRPYNTLATINLAGYYSHQGSARQALAVLNNYLRETEKSPRLKDDPLFPTLVRAQQRYEIEAMLR
jgi:hypothetical protein